MTNIETSTGKPPFLRVVGGTSNPEPRPVMAAPALWIAAAQETPCEPWQRRTPRALSDAPTAQNGRLRKMRREVWRQSEMLRQYWRAMLDLAGAIDRAKSHGVTPQSTLRCLPYDREEILAKWREAFVQQMCTPVFDNAGLKWKQDVLAKEAYAYTGMTPDRLRRLIAEDTAWLAAHPTRRSDGKENVQ